METSLGEERRRYCASVHRISFKGRAIVGVSVGVGGGGWCGAEIRISQVNA
jgi:hypothetical protein